MAFSTTSRLVSGMIVGSGATFGMALGHQPLIWVAIACTGGFAIGWLMPTRKAFRNVVEPYSKAAAYRCPCCSHRTLHERGGDEICPVCFWQDDGQDDHDADIVRDGPNNELSLTAARENYRRIGAADPRRLSHIQPATNEESAG